jgi:putative phosphoribosyl transferase
MLPFADRAEAGRKLADRLRAHADEQDLLVLGLPRGGVVVAAEVAAALKAPLEVFVVRKLGVPGQPELAFGAIASGGIIVLNHDVLAETGLTRAEMDEVVAAEMRELNRRQALYGVGRHDIENRPVILVDDGLATGATMRVAVLALREMNPRHITVAVPVGAPEVVRQFETLADEVVCLASPVPFRGVGLWYEDFSQTTDDQVQELLDAARRREQHA